MRSLFTLPLLATLALCGCETVERDRYGRETKVEDEEKPDEELERRITQAEENPDDPRNWFLLGEYAEDKRGDFVMAYDAYLRMQEAIEAREKEANRKFTGGLFRIGRVLIKLRRYAEAEKYLLGVTALQPKQIATASLNQNFREAHLLLGGLYAYVEQWKLAQKHILAFRELGGRGRGDTILLRADEELERKRSVESSYPKKEGEEGAEDDAEDDAKDGEPKGAEDEEQPAKKGS